ncbi:TIGR04168 family protein [Pantanalinema rosaneae CENA516]|uniref:TIGR04168 family protein n=1 Tax=Pantanalinema rosaneae TaxID=1620701 RepID=UPI003D6ED1E8
MADWQDNDRAQIPYLERDTPTPQPTTTSATDRRLTIAVVGDVHDQWDADDERALQQLGVDLVLLVGDFGNEAVDVVRSIAGMNLPKAVILGNHDAWYSASPWGKQQCPYDRQKEDRVQQQLDLLGSAHVGYSKLDFPKLNLTVVGARPFSWGGSDWKNASFYRSRYGISGWKESTAQIVAAARSATCETVIFLGHCGPTGLGDLPESPCGRDWQPLGGDYGDPDFEQAIAQVRQEGMSIPLVTFGHMHHHLRHTKQYLRTSFMAAEGTIYLNAARVPRIIHTGNQTLRNFSLVTLERGIVTQVKLVWVDRDGIISTDETIYKQEHAVKNR